MELRNHGISGKSQEFPENEKKNPKMKKFNNQRKKSEFFLVFFSLRNLKSFNPNPKNPEKSRDFSFGFFFGKNPESPGIGDPRKIPSESHLCIK